VTQIVVGLELLASIRIPNGMSRKTSRTASVAYEKPRCSLILLTVSVSKTSNRQRKACKLFLILGPCADAPEVGG